MRRLVFFLLALATLLGTALLPAAASAQSTTPASSGPIYGGCC
jgi:ABC-type oligopeptide transport system substrate-binding subunit